MSTSIPDNLIPLKLLDPSETYSKNLLKYFIDNYSLIQASSFFDIEEIDKNYIIGKNNRNLLSNTYDPDNISKVISSYKKTKEALDSVYKLKKYMNEFNNNQDEIDYRFSNLSAKLFSSGLGDFVPEGRTSLKNFIKDLEIKTRMKNIEGCDPKPTYLNESIEYMFSWKNINFGGMPIGTPNNIATTIVILAGITSNNIKIKDAGLDFIETFVYNLQDELGSNEMKKCWSEIERIKVDQLFYNNGKELKMNSKDLKSDPTNNITGSQFDDSEQGRKEAVACAKYIFDYYINLLDKIYNIIINYQKRLNKEIGDEYSKSWEFTKKQYDEYINFAIKKYFIIDENIEITTKRESDGKLTYEYKGEVNNASTYQPTEDYILRMEKDGGVYKDLNSTESVKNMLKFLNFEGETDEVVACGAPIQNLYIFKCSLEQSLVYLDAIAKSKTIMENFLKKKILFIKSCVSGKYIRDTYDSIRTSLNRIMTMTTPQSKENERFKLMKKIGDEYKRYLNRSLNYGKNMLSFIRTGKLRGRNADMNRFEDEIVDVTRMHYEIKAIALKYIFELSYKIIEDDYSGFPMNYGGDIYNEVLTYLNEINEEVTNKYNKKIAIEKAGLINSFKNKVPKIKLSNGKSTLDLLSNKDVNSIKDFILGSGKSTGLSVLSTKSGIKKNLPLDKKDLIKSDKFWKDLRLSMGGKTIYIGVIKYEKPGVFKDKNFYLLDVVNSMIQKKYLRKSPIDTKRKTIRDFLIRSVINNGVLLLVDNTSKLKDPSNWRAMNFDDLDKLGKKKSTSLVRNIFFNIISSNVEFDNIMREEIPDSSLITKEIKELCKLSGPSNLEKCKFIYSRNEFGKGVKRKMNSHSGTKGINLESGTSYAAWTPLEGQVRGALKGGKMVLGFIDK